MRLLLIDNFDSFTHNLSHLLQLCGFKVSVLRNNLSEAVQLAEDYDALCISPGPGNPDSSGYSLDILQRYIRQKPILGVCLGMQLLAFQAGGRVGETQSPIHGHTENITHSGKGLFKNIRNPTTVARYHSLAVFEPGKDFETDAWSEDGVIMGMRHNSLPLFGLQFHPESFMTPEGKTMIETFYSLAQKHNEA